MRFTYATGSAATQAVDLLVLPIFEGPEAGPGVRDVKGVDLVRLAAEAKVKGSLGDTFLVPNTGIDGLAAKAVLLVGVGKRAEAGPTEVRRAAGRAAKRFADRARIATTLPQIGRGSEDALEAAVEGLALGAYRFDRYKSQGGRRKKDVEATVALVGPSRLDRRAANAVIRRATIVTESQCWARDLVNTPALDLPPAGIARAAQAMAREVGLKCKVWNETQLKAGGFGGILGVGSGSANPPRMIELRYDGGSGVPFALTGKGIAFDSGGLSIKTATQMETMKDDMGGAASILATMRAIALLKPKVNVIAAILTITGYSVNDTIVIFDRIRENRRRFKRMGIKELINISTNQTLSRTVLTSVTTSISIVPLLLFGGPTLFDFTASILFGIVVGTFSSIYVAGALLIYLPPIVGPGAGGGNESSAKSEALAGASR